MRPILLFSIMTLVGGVAPAVAADCPVELTIRPIWTEIDASTYGRIDEDRFQVTLRNTGRDIVKLVHPGDGSWRGARTPIVTWVVEGEAQQSRGVCGINPLQRGEILVLNPGDVVELESWIPPIYVSRTGPYEIKLTYRNDPSLEWSKDALYEHDPIAWQQMRRSTPCDIQSNTVQIVVTAVRDRWQW